MFEHNCKINRYFTTYCSLSLSSTHSNTVSYSIIICLSARRLSSSSLTDVQKQSLSQSNWFPSINPITNQNRTTRNIDNERMNVTKQNVSALQSFPIIGRLIISFQLAQKRDNGILAGEKFGWLQRQQFLVCQEEEPKGHDARRLVLVGYVCFHVHGVLDSCFSIDLVGGSSISTIALS